MTNSNNKLLYQDLSYELRGCFFDVYNKLGFGHKEEVYQRALEEELNNKKIPYEREKVLSIIYNGKKIGKYRPDFVIAGKVIIEVKAVEHMPVAYERQLVHYLKATKFQLGFLVNFGSENLIIKRKIWSKHYK